MVNTVAKWLLVLGGLNWGLYAFLNMDLVAYFFGGDAILAKGVYGLIALSAVYKLICCCNSSSCHTGSGKSSGGGCCSH